MSLRGQNSKLNEKQVEQIKIKILENEKSIPEIANEFNVKESTISKIKRCKNWNYVRSDLNQALLSIEDNIIDLTKNRIITYYNKNMNLSMKQISIDLDIPYGAVTKELADKYTNKYETLYSKTIELWNSGVHDLDDISKVVKLHRATINRYLKNGDLSGECVYDIENIIQQRRLKASNGAKQSCGKNVVCVDTNTIYSSCHEVEKSTGISFKCISNCCLHKQKTSGGCRWMYLDEYMVQNGYTDISQIPNVKIHNEELKQNKLTA